MKVPHQEIPEETLTNLIEEFVTREGTDYGDFDYSVKAKVEHVKQALNNGKAYITFDEETESFSLISKEIAQRNESID